MNSDNNPPNNITGKAYQLILNNKKVSALVLIVTLVLSEISLASLYVAKRVHGNFPVVDLIERYYVLRPVQFLFQDQYRFPQSLRKNYIGEGSLPQTVDAILKPDSLRGYVAAPDTVYTEMNYSWAATNAQGFHIVDPQNPGMKYVAPKPGNVFRIVMLGGSTVAGIGSADSFEALPAALQDELRKNYVPNGEASRQIEVINAGIGGYYSELVLLHYLSSIRHLQPDLVITYSGWNDLKLLNKKFHERGLNAPDFESDTHLSNNQILADHYKIEPNIQMAFKLTIQSVRRFLNGFAIIHIPVRAIKMAITPNARQLKTRHGKEAVPFYPESVDRYINNTELLVAINRVDNVRTAWFMQPLVGLGNKPAAEFREKENVSLLQNHISRQRKFYEMSAPKMTQLLDKYSRSPALCAASLTDVFDGNPNSVFEDFGHLFAFGNVIVAKRIAKELRRCGLIEAK
jgi:lysophospholipase L1-like esterase